MFFKNKSWSQQKTPADRLNGGCLWPQCLVSCVWKAQLAAALLGPAKSGSLPPASAAIIPLSIPHPAVYIAAVLVAAQTAQPHLNKNNMFSLKRSVWTEAAIIL